MKRIHVRLLIGIVAAVTVTAAVGSPACLAQESSDHLLFDPDHQKSIEYSDASLNVRVIPVATKLALRLQKAGQALKTVDLPENMVQVNKLARTPSGKLVVVGMFNGDVWSVAIISLDALNISDNFLCYEPSLSPDGKYIAFIKFFPPHGAEGAEDHYMIYDLSKSAAQNRPPGIPTTDWKTVGFTVYPSGVGNHEFDNLHSAEGSMHSFSSAGFFWSPAGDKVVFADTCQGGLSILLVEIDGCPSC